VQVRFLPEFGGKITSLRSVRTGEEFLLPPLTSYRRASASDGFNGSDGGGFDECLPSVASCEGMGCELSIPDHGDLWRLMWHVDSKDAAVVLHADAVSRPLRLTRRATLEGSSLVLEYDLLNLSDAPTSWLWSAHPLLRVDAGDRIVLPDEIEKVSVEYSASGLFNKNTSINWPIAQATTGTTMDLGRVGRKDGLTAHKLFARMAKSGWGGLYREKIGQGIVVRFDPSFLPFMGLWICSGAWPEDGVEKQYTVALEPTTSNTDSLVSADDCGTSRRLKAREHCSWKLEIQLVGASTPVDFKNFYTNANASNPAPDAC
jgi:hypothetical protein